MKISVVIPCLNEGKNLKSAMSSIGGHGVEVIVADGGSTDGTPEVASRLGAVTVESPRGRGLQMDRGASRATGDVILFLHADTVLPSKWFDALSKALEDEGTVAGAFSLSIGSKGFFFRLMESLVKIRSKRLGLIYGDQAIFVRNKSFIEVGGFKRLPLMEDVDCVKRLRRLGRVVLLDERVTTSSRRWVAKGTLKNSLRNLALLSFYFLGVSPETLYRWYYGEDSH